MFTGLIQKIGTVKRVSRGAGLVLEFGFDPAQGAVWREELVKGESVAVNGVCLTVADSDKTRFTANVLLETELRSGLGELLPGARVNLERALKAGAALGGHLVQGHVDGRGTIRAIRPRGSDFQLVVQAGRVLSAQSVLKGSIAIDGVSLTVSALGDDWLGVDLIPTTRSETTLGSRRIGDRVNLETDIVGKYLAKQSAVSSGLTEAKLAAAGFI